MRTFLSYPSERLEDAKRVYRFVRSVGVDCWLDKENLIGGQEWNRERSRAQTEADLFFLICSDETVNRNGVIQREIADALEASKDRVIGQLYIVPLRISDVELPKELASKQYIDLFGPKSWQAELAKTLKVKFGELRQDIPEVLEVALATSSSGLKIPIELNEANESGERSLSFFRYEEMGPYWE